MEIKKILGGISVDGEVKYGISKLRDGRYAVGHLAHGRHTRPSGMFETLDAAFDHWYATLPSADSPPDRA